MEKKPQIFTDEAGFTSIRNGKTLARVEWTQVSEIFAYKEDLITYDDIRLGFRIHGSDVFYIVSEDDLGFKELLAELEHRFTGIRTDWFSATAFPAFATNRTTLLSKPDHKHRQ